MASSALLVLTVRLFKRTADDVPSEISTHGYLMTPRKIRPLRELRRLRSLGDRDAYVPKDNVPSLDSEDSERNDLWPVKRVLVTPRNIVDIQVLAEAGHLGSSS